MTVSRKWSPGSEDGRSERENKIMTSIEKIRIRRKTVLELRKNGLCICWDSKKNLIVIYTLFAPGKISEEVGYIDENQKAILY